MIESLVHRLILPPQYEFQTIESLVHRLILPPQYEFQTIESLVHGQKRQQAPKLAPSGSGQYSLKQDAILIVSDPHVFCSLQLCSELPD